MEGNFVKTIGKGIFQYETEGIALFKNNYANGNGAWICTDQEPKDNTFLLFDRKTLDFIGGFKSDMVQNTDGVWLTHNSHPRYPGFPSGAFIAVNDDGGIGVILLDSLEKYFHEVFGELMVDPVFN